MTTYRHTLHMRLFDTKNTALCELIAWGFSKVESSRLLGFSADTSNACKRAGSLKNVGRIEALKASPMDRREWRYAFAALILNRWPAVKAWEALGKGIGASDAAKRQQASRALRSADVLCALHTLKGDCVLSASLQALWDKHGDKGAARWSLLNSIRCRSYSPRASLVASIAPAAPAVCGAKTRNGGSCKCKPVAGKRRCKYHGGLSTGPKTAAGKARCADGLRRWADGLKQAA